MMGKQKTIRDPLEPEVRHLVNKRLTLNVLIQGAATHTFLTAHHAVRDNINLLDPELIRLYDSMNACNNLGYWKGLIAIFIGRPMKFWNTLNRPNNLFYYHRFMRRHGAALARESRKDALQRCKDKGVPQSGLHNEACMYHLFKTVFAVEARHRYMLEELGKKVCSEIFAIGEEKLDATLTMSPAWGTVREPTTRRGRLMMHAMVGWGGVMRGRGGRLKVCAKAVTWPLLVHELVKGTMELICLHGLNDLPDGHYETVMDHTEHVEYEIPMIQVGPEIYRRFLKVLPREIPIAQCVMKVSQMEPIELEEFMFEMIESPDRATNMIRASHPGDTLD